MAEVVAGVRASAAPVPLEALADRALRALGHEKTIATGWAGAGSFRELLRQQLPAGHQADAASRPYLAFDPKRHGEDRARPPRWRRASRHGGRRSAAIANADGRRTGRAGAAAGPCSAAEPLRHQGQGESRHARCADAVPWTTGRPPDRAHRLHPPPPASRASAASSAAIQQSIARIQDACQAPPLAPHEYRLLFEVMAKEISDNDLIGAQTLANITQRAQEQRPRRARATTCASCWRW